MRSGRRAAHSAAYSCLGEHARTRWGRATAADIPPCVAFLLLGTRCDQYAGAMKNIILLIVAALFAVIGYAQSQGGKIVVLEKNEGETRLRRPMGSLPIPSDEFILS